MANKEKLLTSAQKFISKGQLSKAISEYQALIKAFPKDVRNRQKLAELLSREKRHEEALAEYGSVAKHYTETGFYLKAIAVFKQMQKIEPSRVDIYHCLAELNEKQGLVGNALSEYRNLVAYYDKQAMHSEAAGVLEKMLVLDPGNLNLAAKIAECYMTTGREDEAFEKFQEIIEALAARGEHVRIIKLYERFLEICPEDGKARLPLARALLDSGSADKAIQVLKSLLKQSPEDAGINRCLTDAYVAAEDFANARLTLKHLLKQKQGDLDLLQYYVRICIDAGEVERARDRLEEWREAFLQAGRLAVLEGFYAELAGPLAGDPLIDERLAAIRAALGDLPKPGRTDADAGEKVAAIAEPAFAHDASTVFDDQPPGGPLTPENTAAVDIELDLDLDFDLGFASVNADEDRAAVLPTAEPTREKEPSQGPAAERDIELEVELDLDDLGDLDFDLDFAEEPAAEAQTPEAAPIASTEESSGNAEPEALDLEVLEEFEEIEDLDELEMLTEEVAEPVGAAPAESASADDPNIEAELEEAQYYLQQGLYDDAERVVRVLLEDRPGLSELQEKLAEIRQGRQAADTVESSAFVDLVADLQDDDLLAAADFLDSFGDAARVDDELSQKLVSELDSSDTESYYNLGIAYKEMGLYDDAIAEFAKACTDPARSLDCIVLTGQCHVEAGDRANAMATFKRGLAQPGLSDLGRMTLNFELGLLHQNSGELLDALDYFQRVAENDSFFRDVGELIKILRRELGLDDADDDDGPQGNRDRVSYV